MDGEITEKYLWLNKTTLLATYDQNDNFKQRFEYGLSHTPVKFTQNSTTYYIASDHLGSPRTITDESGNVIKAIDYDSFGNVISDSNESFEIPFGFAGGLKDSDTSLLRFGYRDYDPSIGRWTARDPIGFAGGDTNLYGYVASDPVNFVDPDGLKGWRTGWSYKNGVISKGGWSFDNNNNLTTFKGEGVKVTKDGDGNYTFEGSKEGKNTSCEASATSGGGGGDDRGSLSCAFRAGPVQCSATIDVDENVTDFDWEISFDNPLESKLPYVEAGLHAAVYYRKVRKTRFLIAKLTYRLK